MTPSRSPRREFLLNAGKVLTALPLAGSLAPTLKAQRPAPAETKAADVEPPKTAVHLNVRDLGAKGDGTTKDTLALQQALDRCSILGGGEVLVPAGNYLTGAIFLRSNTTLRIEEGASLLGSPDIADYALTQVRWEGRFIKGYGAFINAQYAENVTITGKGNIVASTEIHGRTRNADGTEMRRLAPPAPGAPTPPTPPAASAIPRPTASNNVARQDIIRNPALMEFVHVKNLLVEDVYTQGNDMWSTHPLFCENVTFKNVIVHSGADGIDVDSCKHVAIDGCTFETRDDCISLKSGRGMEGNTIGIPCEDVHITNCTFNDANFACIGIGSETSGGVRNILVEHCKFIGAKSHAIYIKSRVGRGAFIENITMTDLDVSNVQQGFLRLNQTGSGLQDPAPVPGPEGIPTFRNYKFSNIRVTDVPELVQANEIDPDKPLDGFTLTNVTGTAKKGMRLANMRNVSLSGINVTGFTGPLLSTYNVNGTGLTGAAPLDAPTVPDPIAPPAKPFVLGQ